MIAVIKPVDWVGRVDRFIVIEKQGETYTLKNSRESLGIANSIANSWREIAAENGDNAEYIVGHRDDFVIVDAIIHITEEEKAEPPKQWLKDILDTSPTQSSE